MTVVVMVAAAAAVAVRYILKFYGPKYTAYQPNLRRLQVFINIPVDFQ